MGVIFGLFGLVLIFFIAAAILHLATSLTGIEGRSYGKALATTGVGWGVSLALGAVFGILHMNGGFISGVIGIIASVAVLKGMYATSWGKAILATIIEWVAVIVLIGIPVMVIFGTALAARGFNM